MDVNLSFDEANHIDSFDAFNFLQKDCYGTRSVLDRMWTKGSCGEIIEMWMRDYLTREKKWLLAEHEKESDYYDVVLNNSIKLEIRRSSRNGYTYSNGRKAYYLNLRPTNSNIRYDENAFNDKLKVLENGGYIMAHLTYSLSLNKYYFHLFWFPTILLLNTFPIESRQGKGIIFAKLFPNLLPQFNTDLLY